MSMSLQYNEGTAVNAVLKNTVLLEVDERFKLNMCVCVCTCIHMSFPVYCAHVCIDKVNYMISEAMAQKQDKLIISDTMAEDINSTNS